MTTMPLWPEGIPGQPDPAFADHPAAREVPCLELHLLPAARTPRACVVVCPGGGYAMRAGHEGAPIAQWLNTLGISAVVVQYRVHPWRHPAPISDARRAIRLVRHHAAAWGVDAGRVGILGFSAGGHLACITAALGEAARPEAADRLERPSSRPDALIACYPVAGLVSPLTHRGSRDNLLGPGAGAPEAGAQVRALSPEAQVTAAHPPAFIWHTAEDGAVPVQLSLDLARALADHGVPFALHVWPKGHHGIGLGQPEHGEAADWPRVCAGWLRELGWSSADGRTADCGSGTA
jgi:acetyl esterase/lipase